MAKPQRRSTAARTSREDREPTPEDPEAPKDSMRETVEAIVMAFLLAFLFRSFEAEAFVIPTGSMAPTLYGRHKEVSCDQCEYFFAIGASGEVDSGTHAFIPNQRVLTTVCPNCRYEMDVKDAPVFSGDRILVNKFTYELGEPERFDVIVFKYPESPNTNYIKRLVGLPGESIRIQQGDVYSRRSDDDPWKILRKDDPNKQRVLQLPVYDDRHPPKILLEAGWPERWASMTRGGTDDAIAGWSDSDEGWQQDAEARSYRVAAGEEPQWLRYRHFVPDPEVWENLGNSDPVGSAVPKLIVDFCAYNAFTTADARNANGRSVPDLGLYWVGDLTLNVDVEVESIADGDTPAELTLELVEGPRTYRCIIDLRTGVARLVMLDQSLIADDEAATEEIQLGQAETPIRGAGHYRLAFANVDQRLVLWHDDVPVQFVADDALPPELASHPGTYGAPALNRPTQSDLTPAAVAVSGMEAEANNLVLQRDIYYQADIERDNLAREGPGHETEYGRVSSFLTELAGNPDAWYAEYSNHTQPSGAVFSAIGDHQYFAMGDNSPRSKDSRLWSNERGAKIRHAIDRSALVGKAFFVYWPHGVPFLNDGKGIPVRYHNDPQDPRSYPSFSLPFYPNLPRMKRIR